VKRFVAALAVLLACGSCVGYSSEISGDLRNVGSVTMTFKVTPARVKVGQNVRFAFRLVNNAGREEKLTFPTGQRYDFWATMGSREAWRWSDGRVFVQVVTREQIAPQSAISFAESWVPEREGNYVVHGELKAQGYGRALTGRVTVE
jgi:hypothetical protein